MSKKRRWEEASPSTKSNAIFIDTNVLINDPNAISVLMGIEGKNLAQIDINELNTVCVPLTVLLELDNLKSKKEAIKTEIVQAQKNINILRKDERFSRKLKIIQQKDWSGLEDLDREVNDFKILASLNYFIKNNSSEYKSIKFVSEDAGCQVFAGHYFPNTNIDTYKKDEVSGLADDGVKTIFVPEGELKVYYPTSLYNTYLQKWQEHNKENCASPICKEDYLMPYDCHRFLNRPEYGNIFENEGVIVNIVVTNISHLVTGEPVDDNYIRCAIRKGEHLYIVREDISAFAIKPYNINGNGFNWAQAIALAVLLDPEIDVVIMNSGAGTGKTILALAAALQQVHIYKRVVLASLMVAVDDKEIGFLPGSAQKKVGFWAGPYDNNLDRILELAGRHNPKSRARVKVRNLEKLETALREKGKTVIRKKADNQTKNGSLPENPREFIDDLRGNANLVNVPITNWRGVTWHNAFIIVDDVQNATKSQFKTMLTRLGENAKMVLTGDVKQIDLRRYLNERNSGLTHAVSHLRGGTQVAVVNFKDTVRSPFVAFVEEHWEA